MSDPTWKRGDRVAVYEMGDLRGNPAKVTLDTIIEVRAATFKLAGGKVFNFAGYEYRRKDGRYQLLRVDDPTVIRVLDRQRFEALREKVSRAALSTHQGDESRLRAALDVLKGGGGEW